MEKNSFETRKRELQVLAKTAGFSNLKQMCDAVGVCEANIYSNLRGTFKMSMKRMFLIANIVHRPIDDIIKIFFPEEIEANERSCLSVYTTCFNQESL